MKGRKVVEIVALTLLCVALGVVAAMQYRTILAKEDTEQSGVNQIEDLRETVIKLNSELDAVTKEREDLQARLDRIEQSSHDELIKDLQTELDSVKLFGGLTDVKGRGIYVQLSVAERANTSALQNRLLLLVNELRACGAQAISINGQRVIATSEIRVVGEYIVVNAEQLPAPYDVYAIGDPSELYNGITMGGNGIVYTINATSQTSGISCIWRTEENVQISAYKQPE